MKQCAIMLITLSLIINSSAFADFPPWDADVIVAQKTTERRQSAPAIHNAAGAIGYFFIRMFQVVISPQDGPNCRYRPTCSEYGRQAVMRYGLVMGGFLAGDRIIRCNPFAIPNHDPVPQTLAEHP